MERSGYSYKVKLSEKELEEAISDYIYKKEGDIVYISSIKHLVGSGTEGYGMMEIDVPYQEGVEVTVTGETY